MLKQMTVSSYPYMKEDKAKDLHRRTHKQAYPGTHETLIGPAALAKFLQIQKSKENINNG